MFPFVKHVYRFFFRRFFWNLKLKRWTRRIMREDLPDKDAKPDTVAIIESFKRPQNIELLARLYLKIPFISKVIISNNNRLIRIRDWVSHSDPRLFVYDQPMDRACHFRFELARREKSPYFIFNDDDIFLSPGQISRLLSALHLDPSRLHGVQGQIYSETHDSLIHRDSYVFGVEKEADIINRIYACDFEHIRGFFCLIDMLSTNHKFIYWYKSFWDDMVLSFTGKSKPMTHDVGYVLNCPTSSQAGIAEWRREGFFENRNRLFHRLRTLKSF
ncbi:hypothetical protein A3A67_05140 [Candidatus Peribacteria bacterium RIFCSPLOWO2_01_FULL_51_18]|nr:MAG: hypothetical protein A3C52_04130 [Candidatus Peribacteria bacterium RIFCSPHIGHO2_02_FULL_51_15]OGJ66163.1 MAG: hypothetical protein A3A67_05140 [Candidatus Peribacteria bacterium RIFCSPLOWO2_01_FULL_51_18]OGJ68875.1 MAG: hypothetical protein A3J34_02290 [Candidatus Peribacteria bacterium RIFCSPLOWO2_02_FULL_51_10]